MHVTLLTADTPDEGGEGDGPDEAAAATEATEATADASGNGEKPKGQKATVNFRGIASGLGEL